MNFPIDAVIPWVDGEDPVLKAKRKQYTFGSAEIERRDDIAAPTRYASLGEIYWCLRSIQRNASFIRKIFIVTDGQDPEISKHIPDFRMPVEIVDHKEIFRGYEQYLPVFNSNAIEAVVWRIPGLSENSIYFNDDLMVVRPTEVSDWFDKDGTPVLYGKMYSTLEAKIARRINWIFKGRKVVKYRDGMLLAAMLPGIEASSFIRMQHTPRTLKKSLLKDYYDAHPEAIIRNISHRFRDISQFNGMALNYLLQLRRYKSRPIPTDRLLVTMGPSGDHRFMRRFKKLTTSPEVKFLCVNSMDEMTEPQREMIESWLKSTLED